MKAVKLKVGKADVFNEVAKTTSYAGAKMMPLEQGAEKGGAVYDRVFTTDEDRTMLERFWVEACAAVTALVKPFIVSVAVQPEVPDEGLRRDYVAELEISSAYDENLTDSINASLFSFFVAAVVAKWMQFVDKTEAERYGADALGMLGDVRNKIYFRKKPRRVVPSLSGGRS